MLERVTLTLLATELLPRALSRETALGEVGRRTPRAVGRSQVALSRSAGRGVFAGERSGAD